MDTKTISRILDETAYVRTGGSEAELKAAEYIRNECAKFGCQAQLQSFDVDMATIQNATLTADGVDIPCKGYLCAGSGTVEAPPVLSD